MDEESRRDCGELDRIFVHAWLEDHQVSPPSGGEDNAIVPSTLIGFEVSCAKQSLWQEGEVYWNVVTNELALAPTSLNRVSWYRSICLKGSKPLLVRR